LTSLAIDKGDSERAAKKGSFRQFSNSSFWIFF